MLNSKVSLVIYEVVIGLIAHYTLLGITSPIYTFLSWTIPSIYFLYKLPKYRIKLIVSALLWGIPGSIIIDVLGHYSRAWEYWTNPLFASTGIQFLYMPIESFYWGLSFWLFTVLVYEYYFDKHKGYQFRSIEKILTFVLSLVGIFAIYIAQNKIVGRSDYFYSIVLIIGSLVSVIILYKYKKLRVKAIYAALYLFLIGIIVELFSFLFGFWIFPAKAYLYSFNLFGKTMPLEEILWWFVISLAVILVHEIFVDTKD